MDLKVIESIVEGGLDSQRRELDFRIVVGYLHSYISTHAVDAETLEQGITHSDSCLTEWPSATRVVEKRWWMDIEDREPIGDWDTGEQFRGWRVPPDWRMRLARRAVIKHTDLDLRSELVQGLFTHPGLAWLEELSIEQTVGPGFVARMLESGAFDHLKVLDLHFSGLSKEEMAALKNWRKRFGVAGENKGYKYS